MTKKRLLITGVSGLLGNNLAYAWRDECDLYGVYHRHPVHMTGIQTSSLDLLNAELLKHYIDQIKPQVIVNCAALTNIDYCEDHPEEARRLNAGLVNNLINIIGDRDIKLVHISTDNVFDGQKGDYKEEDHVNPINVYGQTKYTGEQEALKNARHLVIRTNIFGWNVQDKCSLAEWCIKELSQKNRIKGFTDVYFSSIYTIDLADIIREAITANLSGVFHMASASSISKYDFLVKVAELFELNVSLIEPIEVAGFPFRARRGRNLTLSVSKLQSSLDIRVPAVEESLKHFYEDRRINIGIRK